MAVLWAATKARLLPASRCPPTVGKLIHSSPPASAHLRAGVGQLRTWTPPVRDGRIRPTADMDASGPER